MGNFNESMIINNSHITVCKYNKNPYVKPPTVYLPTVNEEFWSLGLVFIIIFDCFIMRNVFPS